MVTNAEYNAGRPYFVAFRPLLHSTKRLTNDELKDYEKHFMEIEDLEYQSEQLKKLKLDTMDLELELKLAKDKVKEGKFQMSDMYLESLRPRFEESWKKLGKAPMPIVMKKISKEEVSKGITEAKAQREKYIKKNPQKDVSVNEELTSLKGLIEASKRKGKVTTAIENKVTIIKNRIRPFKGKVPENDSKQIIDEIAVLKKEVEKL